MYNERMNNNTAKLLGTSDEVTTCECCGKSNLKLTVAIEISGEVVHYGRDCAAKTFRVMRSGSWRHKATADAIMANAQSHHRHPNSLPIFLA